MNESRGREATSLICFPPIGAIYLDGGMDAAKHFFFAHFTHQIEEHMKKRQRNWKAELQDYSQKKHQKPPVYKILKETGPDHRKIFHIAACIDDVEIGEGMGSSKKEAEQAAAENRY